MTFPTTYLDRVLEKKRSQLEKERQNLLEKVIYWLDRYGLKYGIKRAYVFGSITKLNRFSTRSDIDIAVEMTNMEYFFSLGGWLSEVTGREVDIIPIQQCHFANRIRETGIQWTPKS